MADWNAGGAPGASVQRTTVRYDSVASTSLPRAAWHSAMRSTFVGAWKTCWARWNIEGVGEVAGALQLVALLEEVAGGGALGIAHLGARAGAGHDAALRGALENETSHGKRKRVRIGRVPGS